MYLTETINEDDGIATDKACAFRWIGHLVKAFQCTVNKFGIYLADLEKFDKKEKKAKIKTEISGNISRWRDYW